MAKVVQPEIITVSPYMCIRGIVMLLFIANIIVVCLTFLILLDSDAGNTIRDVSIAGLESIQHSFNEDGFNGSVAGIVTTYKGTVPQAKRDAIPADVLQSWGLKRDEVMFYKIIDGNHRNTIMHRMLQEGRFDRFMVVKYYLREFNSIQEEMDCAFETNKVNTAYVSFINYILL